MVISPSFTQCTSDSVIARSPDPMVRVRPHQLAYPAVSVLAQIERRRGGQQEDDAARGLERDEVAAERRRGLAEDRDADVAAVGQRPT